MTFPHLRTPDIERIETLVRDCYATQAIGIVTGPNGVGKTEALKAVSRRWSNLGLPGAAFYLRANAIRGHTRALKDLLEALGRKQSGANSSGSVAYAIHALRHEMGRQKIEALLIDEADQWNPDGLASLIALYDACLESGKGITLILASAFAPDTWIGAIRSGRSRSLRTVEIPILTVPSMLGVLKSWGFTGFAAAVAAGDPAAAKVATRLHQHVGGVFRRLGYFAALHRQYAGDTIDQASLDTIIPKLAAA